MSMLMVPIRRGDTRSRVPDIRMRKAPGTLAKWSGDVVSSQVPVLAGCSCSFSCPLRAIKWSVKVTMMMPVAGTRWAFVISSISDTLLVILICVVGRSVVSAAAHFECVDDALKCE